MSTIRLQSLMMQDAGYKLAEGAPKKQDLHRRPYACVAQAAQ
jgi:hypothetical protein